MSPQDTQEAVYNALVNKLEAIEDILFNLHLDVAVEENAQVKAALEKVSTDLYRAFYSKAVA